MAGRQNGSNSRRETGPDTKWFVESPLNLLVDYYTEVPFRPYGAGATRENVVPVLRDLKLGCIIIYAKGHSGYTTFPSALRTEHTMLAKDMPAFFREVTRETGTRLILYYSGMLDGIAGLRHPEWRMVDREGHPQQTLEQFESLFITYPNCPLSPYFDEWVAVHLEEMIGRYEPDGIWVDGDWAGPCYCPRCEERFRRESGFDGPMPEFNLLTPEGIAWTRTWARITHEWRTKFNALVKSLKPDCLYSAGNVTARKEFLGPFDWRSGDWFSPNNHRLHMSISMRQYTTLGIPYDAYTCDTCFVHSRPELRARTKTLTRMLQEGATLLANGGQWGYWTYPMPNGAFVPSKMRMASRAAKFARERAPVCLGTRHVPWTAVLNAEPCANLEIGRIAGAGKALIALHRSPVFIDESGLSADMEYDLIVVPANHVIDDGAVGKLAAFVRKGGRLLSSGASIHSKAFQRLLGVRLTREGEVDDGHVFLKDGRPAGVFAPWDRLEMKEAKGMYPLLLSWDHFNPECRRIRPNYPIHGMVDEENPQEAHFPAATCRRLGRGLAVHIATNFFDLYWRYGNPDMLAWLREILDLLQPEPLLATDAPSFVEVALRQKSDALLLHVINGNPGRDLSLVGSDDYWVDDIPSVGPFTFAIRCGRKPRSATWEPEGARAETRWNKSVLRVTLPRLEIHTCLALKGWTRRKSPRA